MFNPLPPPEEFFDDQLEEGYDPHLQAQEDYDQLFLLQAAFVKEDYSQYLHLQPEEVYGRHLEAPEDYDRLLHLKDEGDYGPEAEQGWQPL